MGVLGFFKKSVSDLFIARGPEAGEALVWRYPDQSVPNGAKLTVRADESAVFFKEGRLAGELGPGTYRLETHHIPFLGDLVVSPLTGDNHYLTELFFVRRTEHLHLLGDRPLGTFMDVASRLVVGLRARARVGLRVTSPSTLITTLAGLRASGAEHVAAFLDARLASLLSASLGQLVASEPVLQIVSNQYSEALGQDTVARARTTFAAEGLEIVRFLELVLTLEPEAAAALRRYGEGQAALSLEREGADLAAQPGFAQYHLVHGQRALLSGMGAGAAQGGISALGLGVGGPAFGAIAVPQVGTGPALMNPSPARLAPPTQRVLRWYLRTSTGVEGPYGARQLALRASGLGLDGDSALVRAVGSEDWTTPTEEPDIRQAFTRRADAQAGPRPALPASATDSFERTLTIAVEDKRLTDEELAILAGLAMSAGIAKTQAEAERYVRFRAQALGCALDEPKPAPPAAPGLGAAPTSGAAPVEVAPPPMPPPMLASYVYSNGLEQVNGLPASAVAARVRAVPDGVHKVWQPGMSGWLDAAEVGPIAALLGS